MQRKYLGVLLIAAIKASSASAETCAPPPGFVDTPHPEIAPIEQLISRTEEVTIERSLAAVRAGGGKTSLEETIDRTSGLPGVTGTYRLTQGPFQKGTRRLVCLTDGGIVVEEVLLMEQKPDEGRFRYVVWNYTSPAFPPISYAVGEFVHSALGDSRTRIRWTYSFQPDRNRFPGNNGELGDSWFRTGFLDREFARWMRNNLAGSKKRAEALPP